MVALSSTSLRLSWTTLSNDAWNGERTGFKIVVVEVETNNMTSIITLPNSAATQYTVSSLHPYYSYRCRIVAYNSAGNGPFSSPRTIRLPPDSTLDDRNEVKPVHFKLKCVGVWF